MVSIGCKSRKSEPSRPQFDSGLVHMTYTTPGYKPDFDHDFSRGKVGENLIDTFLQSIEGGSVEVKTDYRVTDTGNVYIEFEQWNRGGKPKPSGIMTSKATHWVIASPDGTGGILVDTEWLRDLILEGPRVFPIGRQNIVNGDTNGSSGYLVPVQYLYQKLKLLP